MSNYSILRDSNKPGVSPGPTSDAGKAISSRNALKHGSCSFATLILPGESREDFDVLQSQWFEAYPPDSEHEAELIRTAVRADWFFQRSERNYVNAEAFTYTEQPDPLLWDRFMHGRVELFQRYRTTQTNALAKARKAVEDYRKNRNREAAQEQTMLHKEEKQTIFKANSKPKPTEHDQWQAKRQEAIRLGRLNPDGSLIDRTL